MSDYTPRNPKNPDEVKIEKRSSIDNLPSVFQTKINTEFLSATLDHLIQPQASHEIDGYIGIKPSYFNKISDFYVAEPNNLRDFYQLTTAMVQTDPITGDVDKTLFYDDLINHLRFQGADVTNHERLFSQDYYSWQPPIDLDKFVNFRNYFWVPNGGLAIEVGVLRVTHSGDSQTDIFSAPNDLTIDVNHVQVELNGTIIPEYDSTLVQSKWYKVFGNKVQIYPIPTISTSIRISLFASSPSDIAETIIGQETCNIQLYPGFTKTLSSGSRIKIINDVTSAYNDKVFIVEGVGRGIWLVEDSLYETGWDNTGWDESNWDYYIDVNEPDYIVMERGAQNSNPWSLYNRWFHRDVIENFYDKNLVKVQAQRPIIEFQRDLELYNYGSIYRDSIQLVVDNIPNFLNIILGITESGYDYEGHAFWVKKSKHNPNLNVWQHKDYDIEIWSGVGNSPEVWPARNVGYSEIRINGVQLFDGLRLLLINDLDLSSTDRVYEINGIADNGTIIPTISLDGANDDGQPAAGETLININTRKQYVYDDAWKIAQTKTAINTAPLFNVYDVNKNYIGNEGTYPKNNFSGNKIFSYQEGGAKKDSVLGLNLVYDAFGGIQFENNLVTNKASYIDADNNTQMINGFYFHRTIVDGDANDVYSNDWHKIPYTSPQKFTQKFVVKDNNIFRLKMVPRNLLDFGTSVEIKVNHVEITDEQYFLQENILRILPGLLNNGDEIEVVMIGDLVGQNEQKYVSEQFEYDDSNIFTLAVAPISPITSETINATINGVPVNFLDLTNEGLNANQVRIDTPLNAGDIVVISVLVPSQQESDYAFWNTPINLDVNPNNEEIEYIARGNFIEHFTNAISRQSGFEGNAEAVNNYRDTGRAKFLGDKILQHTAPMLKIMYMVADQRVDFIKSTQYVEREYTRFKNKFAQQLKNIQDTNELLDSDDDSDWVNLALDRLNAGKTSDFPFYNSGVGGQLTWIPPTPAFLGAMPVYEPAIVWDNTSGVPTQYIRGHDGSMLLAYGDKRDSVFLTLEYNIYNSIPEYIRDEALEAFDFRKIKPGKFRTTEYTYQEYINALAPTFERWAVNNSVNFRVNSLYDDFDPFTWNYSTSVDFQNQRVPGHWRGIYMYYFDTDKPHTHPWECLGFSEKPSWWDDEYGVAPYTRGNTPMWTDIAEGRIIKGPRKGTYAHLKRSTDTIGIWDVLPVNDNGDLLSPIDAGIIRIPPAREQASAPWNPGDFGPVETVWAQSEQWPFAQVQAAYLMKPAQFIEATWDSNRSVVYETTNYTIGSNDQIVDLSTNYRNKLSNILVHDELQYGNAAIKYGVQQFLAAYLKQNGLDTGPSLGDPLRNTYVRLGHKMAGYVTNNKFKVLTDSFGLVPNEDVTVKLYESPSIKEDIYSGVIVEWTGKSYRVYGYDVLNPEFKIIPNNPNGKKTKITIGSKLTNFDDWKPQTLYLVGQIAVREDTYYYCKETHKSGNTFNPSYWSATQRPKTTSRIELIKKHEPIMGSPVVSVPYGTEYRSIQDVFDFFMSYERYLESRGWLFNDFDSDLQVQKDWTFSGKQFALWSINQWNPGTFITLSPSSKKLKYQAMHGVIKPLEQVVNGVYSLLNRNGDRVETNKTIVSRRNDTVEIVPEDPSDNLQGIYAARVYISELEHAVFFNNKTIFNDLIYDPLYGLRQLRLRISLVKTLDWTGRLDAPGFLVSNDSLISNYEKTTNDFRKYFDIEDQVDDIGLKNYANHLIAYQQRPYLNDLIISDKSQLNFYQGMIQQKGTPGALNKLLRSEFITQDSSLEMLEEWAFRMGSYGAYDSQPSLEIRIPVSDYDNDPQLIDLHEVNFDDVSFPDLMSWINSYNSGIGIPENRDQWSNEIWDDWFNTFFKDDPNDKTISAYIVRDNSGRILAGDNRWERRPDTTARSYTDYVFPMIPYGENTEVLPTAGYVHVDEYDHVFAKASDFLALSVYDDGNKKYSDGDVIWIYNNKAFDYRKFILDATGQNVIDYNGRYDYTGTTSFSNSWSTFRLLKQDWTIVTTKPIQTSSYLEVQTQKPHGMKKGEVIVIYDNTAKSIFANLTPIVIRDVPSQYKIRIPASQFGSNSFTSTNIEVLKLVETRFNTLTKTDPTSYSVSDYTITNSEAAYARKDKLWVDEGINLSDMSKTNGWVTYNLDWFNGEDESQNIVYAEIPNTSTLSAWTVKTGLNALNLSVSKYVLGKATVTAYANGKYELKDSDILDIHAELIGLDPYSFAYDATESLLSIWLGTEWRDFADPVWPALTEPIYGNYQVIKSVRKETLTNFEGRFYPGYSMVAAGFSAIDKFFRAADIQIAAPSDGSYWIFVDNDGYVSDNQIYHKVNGSWNIADYDVGDCFWDSNTQTMQKVISVAPNLMLAPVTLVEKEHWFDKDTKLPFTITKVVDALTPIQIEATSYFWYDMASTTPSGIWKKLENANWVTSPTLANGTLVYNLTSNEVYRKIANPAVWESYTGLMPIDYRILLSNIKQILVKTTTGIKQDNLSKNEFIFDGHTMFYWDGTTVSSATISNGERWINIDVPVVIDNTSSFGFNQITLSGNAYWFNKDLGLLYQYSSMSNRFIRINPLADDIWINGTTAYKYNDVDVKFDLFVIPNDTYLYDFANQLMFKQTSNLNPVDLTSELTKFWLFKEQLYSSNSGKLEQVTLLVNDLFYDKETNVLNKFDGNTLVPATLTAGYKISSKDSTVYFYNGTSLGVAAKGLYWDVFGSKLYDWSTTLASTVVSFLTFGITKFVNVLIDPNTNDYIIGNTDLFDITNDITFPQIEQQTLLDISWNRLGPVIKEVRRELQKVDTHSILNSVFYDSHKQQVDAYAYAYDPVKGIIPGQADKEIWFKLSVDPAVYSEDLNVLTINSTAKPKALWGREHVGKTWWDLSTTRYLDYEMDDIEYRRNNWGKHAPLSSVDIYEWVRSIKTPETYEKEARQYQNQDETGTKPAGVPYKRNGSYVYNSISEFDENSNTSKTYYYFWVKNKRTLPNINKVKYNRKLTGSQISAILTKPSGIIWANPIAHNAFIFANAVGVISGNDSVLQVNWKANHNDGNTHREFVLGREGDENWIADDPLWVKMKDSLLGYVNFTKITFVSRKDANRIYLNEALGLYPYGLIKVNGQTYEYRYGDGNYIELITGNTSINVGDVVEYEAYLPVPDPVLTETQKYGTLFRPRQSWFKDYKLARKNLVENFNYQMQQVWLGRDRFDWDANLYQTEPLPDSSEYDKELPDLLSRDVLIKTIELPVGYRVLVLGNNQTDDFWTLWELTDNSQTNPVWELRNAQRYKLTDLWKLADYYDASVDPANPPLRIFKNVQDFTNKSTGSNAIEFYDGELIKILNVSDQSQAASFWEWRKYDLANDEWTIVAREKGTIQLDNSFYSNNVQIITKDHFYRVQNPSKRNNYTPYWDMSRWDITPWDDEVNESGNLEGIDLSNVEVFVQYLRGRDGSIELGLLLDEIRSNQNFVTYLEQNRLFFSMINYVHAEQDVVDWAFKTSYIAITGYTEQLNQSQIIYPDIIEPLFDYISEVKPYHVKIRDFSRRVGYTDPSEVQVDDISRDMLIVQKFDRVSCDSSLSNFSPAWDLVPWDIYPWDPQAIVGDSATEPFLFRIYTDGKTTNWDIVETPNNKFYNVMTKVDNKTENLFYYPVLGYEATQKWIDNVESIKIKDPIAGTEVVLPEAQWSIVDTSNVPGVVHLHLSIAVAPVKGQIIEITRIITEFERIQRMYKSIDTTKLGNKVLDIIPNIANISGCDFKGVDVNGGDFGAGWDTTEWDAGSGIVQLPGRLPYTNINQIYDDVSIVQGHTFWFDDTRTPDTQLRKFDGSQYKGIDPIIGDSFTILDTGIIKIWNGSQWLNSQAYSDDGWDQVSYVAPDADINNGPPSEWDFFTAPGGTSEFTLETESSDFGNIAYIVVYVDNDLVVMNGSDSYDYTWNSNTMEVSFNSNIPANTNIKVFKVYDYAGTDNITSTFLSPLADPTQNPWETLVDGGEFNQPWVEANRPEELALIKTPETLVIDVYNRPSPGAPILSKNKFIGTGSTGPYPIYNIAESIDSIYIYCNGVLVDADEYEIDWKTQSITFNSSTIVGAQYILVSHSSGGDAIWETKYIPVNGQSYSLSDIPVVHDLMVTIDGLEVTNYTVTGKSFTQQELDNGVPWELGDFTLSFASVPTGTNITVTVIINVLNGLLFNANAAVIHSSDFEVGVDNTSSINQEFTDLGFYSNETGNATEFTLDMASAPDFPEWDKVIVYVNGERICGPDVNYIEGDNHSGSFDINPVSVPIDKNKYVVYVDDTLMPKDEWTLRTYYQGLIGASLDIGYESGSDNWDYSDPVWAGKIHLEVFDTENSFSGDVDILDKDNDGVISAQDFVDSIMEEIQTNSYWDIASVGLNFEVKDNKIEITHLGAMNVTLSEVNNIPLVSSFFGSTTPSITGNNVEPYALGTYLNSLSNQGIDIIEPVPDTQYMPENGSGILVDNNSTDITVSITHKAVTTAYTVPVYDGIEIVDDEISINASLADGEIDFNDFYLSMKMFFDANPLSTGPITIDIVDDVTEFISICVPPATTIVISDIDVPVVSAFFGVEQPSIESTSITDELFGISSAWSIFRINNKYIGVEITDIDDDSNIGINDVVNSINQNEHLQEFGISASIVNTNKIKIAMTSNGFLQMFDGDENQLVTNFFGSNTFAQAVSVESDFDISPNCERHKPHITISVNHIDIDVEIKDIDYTGKLTPASLTELINQHELLKVLNVTAEVTSDGYIRIKSSNDAYLKVKDAESNDYDYQIINYFFGSWKTSKGGTITTVSDNKIHLGSVVGFDTTIVPYHLWQIDYIIPNYGIDIIVGVFENHAFEIEGTALRILQTLVSGDKVSVIAFNSNNSMKMRTERFIGNEDGIYQISHNEYIWVSMNGKRLIYKKDYDVITEYYGWDYQAWDGDEYDTTHAYKKIVIVEDQSIEDDICITTFAGEPRTNAVAWRMFRTANNGWEHIRISDANKTYLKADLLDNSTSISVWENDKLFNYVPTSAPLMTPNVIYRLPGTIWVDGERINYWDLQGPYIENNKRWWKLDNIVRSTYKTTFGIKDKIITKNYQADGTTISFAIPTSNNYEKIIVEVNGIRQIERVNSLEVAVHNNEYIGNFGSWDWDYEILNDHVVFREAPGIGDDPYIPSIRITVIEYTYETSHITHEEGELSIDGNITQRLPDNYVWKWGPTAMNRGMQRNNDANSKFLLERPGTPE